MDAAMCNRDPAVTIGELAAGCEIIAHQVVQALQPFADFLMRCIDAYDRVMERAGLAPLRLSRPLGEPTRPVADIHRAIGITSSTATATTTATSAVTAAPRRIATPTASIPSESHLSERLAALWNSLSDQPRLAKELSDLLYRTPTNEAAIRQGVHRLRTRGFEIKNIPSLGYIRPVTPRHGGHTGVT